jgi:membrane-bound metal-dependent hydrolase YbcI (DUF457 family)
LENTRAELDSAITNFVATLVGVGTELARLGGLALLAVLGIGAALGVGKVLDEVLTHRGFIHSLGFAAVLAGAVVISNSDLPHSRHKLARCWVGPSFSVLLGTSTSVTDK